MEISTSVLNVNEEKLNEILFEIEMAKTNYFHIDVMDGEFVASDSVKKMSRYAEMIKLLMNTPMEVHLMVKDVEKYVEMFEKFSPKTILFHPSVLSDMEKAFEIIKRVKEKNIKVGIVISPNEKIEDFMDYYPKIHQVLIMTVTPGMGGQEIIWECLEKVDSLRGYLIKNDIDLDIEIDGGVKEENIGKIREKDIDIAVVGTAVVNSNDILHTMKVLKGK